jgi:UDP-galactopyranose mutase
MVMDYDIIVVGAGLSGATIAEHCARHGFSVLVVEKRDHIAGNCYDEIDKESGIRISRYGAHLFHTNEESVWEYVQRFGAWQRWDHKVVADISGRLVPVPVNITTVNSLLGLNLKTTQEMAQWLDENQVRYDKIENSEQAAKSRVGETMFNLLFRDYTYKQWNRTATELEPLVLQRIPVRCDFDDRYFSDRFQALPIEGYTKIVERMLAHPFITVKLNTDWSSVAESLGKRAMLVFTGPIDQYFASAGLPPLQYRSINFHWERLPLNGYYQPNSVVNYPSAETPYTRCIEYKHFLHQKSSQTIVCRETTCEGGEPYYPIPTKENEDLYKKYAIMAAHEKGVHFVGRLANYKYFNMDAAIKNAMDYFERFILPELNSLKDETPAIKIEEVQVDAVDKGE